LVVFISKSAELRMLKSLSSYKSSDPQLDERRVFGIKPEISRLDIRSTGTDVIRLVKRKTIEPRRNARPQYRAADQGEQHQKEDQMTLSTRVNKWRTRVVGLARLLLCLWHIFLTAKCAKKREIE
ncbi:MAG: hypothetical protein ACR2KZ_22665, partial [Segetibacter sp.]